MFDLGRRGVVDDLIAGRDGFEGNLGGLLVEPTVLLWEKTEVFRPFRLGRVCFPSLERIFSAEGSTLRVLLWGGGIIVSILQFLNLDDALTIR